MWARCNLLADPPTTRQQLHDIGWDWDDSKRGARGIYVAWKRYLKSLSAGLLRPHEALRVYSICMTRIPNEKITFKEEVFESQAYGKKVVQRLVAAGRIEYGMCGCIHVLLEFLLIFT